MEKSNCLNCPNCNRHTFEFNFEEKYWICSTCWYFLNEDCDLSNEIKNIFCQPFIINTKGEE